MAQRKPFSPESLTVRAMEPAEIDLQAVVPPIHTATTFRRAPDGSFPGGRGYSRDANPTYDAPERLLAQLEGGEQALLFSSGMAAATTLLDALEIGDRVVAPRQMYWSLRSWLLDLQSRGRLRVELVPAGDLEALEKALAEAPTRLVWLETPANPTCEITDLTAATELAHAAGAQVAVDNTVPTPVLTRPIEHGADYVVHSATKALNGHSDVLAGGLVTAASDGIWERVHHERRFRGAIPGPFEAWLLLRGMRTLFLRVARTCETALRLAEALDDHPAVAEVLYPGLPHHPGHDVARRQMEGGYGAILALRVRAGESAARRLASGLELFTEATSLGGVESLVEHRASIEGEGTQAPADLLRLAIGIERAEDLLGDLEHALDAL